MQSQQRMTVQVAPKRNHRVITVVSSCCLSSPGKFFQTCGHPVDEFGRICHLHLCALILRRWPLVVVSTLLADVSWEAEAPSSLKLA